MADTRERLRAVVERIAEKPIPQDPDESLFENGHLDSQNISELADAIEAEFSIKIPDSDLNPRKFESLARMEAYLNK